MKHIRLPIITVALALFAVTSCTIKDAKLYSGPARPDAELAVVTLHDSIKLRKVDGSRTPRTLQDPVNPIQRASDQYRTDRTMRLLPGTHTIVWAYDSGAYESYDSEFTFSVEAGKRYALNLRSRRNDMFPGLSKTVGIELAEQP